MEDHLKNIIIQAHGFNSGPGTKAHQLKMAFPDVEVWAPQLPYDPIQAYSQLSAYVESQENCRIFFVGTSLGAFYGLCLSTQFFDDRFYYYLINTSLQPHITLRSYLHQTVTNFKTMERHYVDEDMLLRLEAMYKRMYAGMQGKSIARLQIFEGSEDDIIDHSILRQWLKSYEVPLRISTHECDHRFENIAPIVDRMKVDMK